VDFQFFEQSTADGAMPSREDESDITYLAGQTYSNPDLNRIHYMHNLTTSVQESWICSENGTRFGFQTRQFNSAL